MTNQDLIQAICADAVEEFLTLKGNCAEVVLKSLRNHLELPLTDDQLAISTAFGGGMHSGCSCGSLTGAVMAVSLETGRKPGIPSENPPRSRLFAAELVEEFQKINKVTCCRALTAGLEKGNPERARRCAGFVEQMSRKAAEILLREREKNTP
jgi:C_GCAxxG_C_C family probable redox protein